MLHYFFMFLVIKCILFLIKTTVFICSTRPLQFIILVIKVFLKIYFAPLIMMFDLLMDITPRIYQAGSSLNVYIYNLVYGNNNAVQININASWDDDEGPIPPGPKFWWRSRSWAHISFRSSLIPSSLFYRKYPTRRSLYLHPLLSTNVCCVRQYLADSNYL